MKLYSSTTSPFVRKVQVVAEEAGIADRITLVPVLTMPTKPSDELIAKNPLVKMPALELDDGSVLYDSRVICEYLDTLHERRPLIPASGAPRWTALREQALADGILDAGILVRYETVLRPAAARSQDWIEAQCLKVTQGLEALVSQPPRLGDHPTIGVISTVCALGWLEFRNPLASRPSGPIDMRKQFPEAFAWYEEARRRPSFEKTEPRG
ncbi:MAG: glutathione S-transferase [Polyangiaceae bacterium]|nr:glutathione S-transferase [Polyangiaceae bacterium]